MKRAAFATKRKDERGIVILLVAVFLLFVVGAMAALAVDVVSFYTARSEAQLAADGAALAAARVIANSGMTSNPSNLGLVTNVEILARTVATQVALHNKVGGRNLVDDGREIKITIVGAPSLPTNQASANPQITVQISRTDLPTFFARIFGRTSVAVNASATAEAYNPSGLNASAGQAPPVAPVCVKPWVLPNMDPRDGSQIFDPTTGAIQKPDLLGADLAGTNFFARCQNGCPGGAPKTPTPWRYYPGDQSSFAAPTKSIPACSGPLTPYQESVAGCVQIPISCNSQVDLDMSAYANRNVETADAVDCFTHSKTNGGDSLDTTGGPNPPFQFIAGDDNPLAAASGSHVLVSDSVVTVPIYNSTTGTVPSSPVTVIGFVQLFMNPDGHAVPGSNQIATVVVNLVGCGTNATGQAVQGNGGSAVAVRLLSQ